jgi:hypothetical protein
LLAFLKKRPTCLPEKCISRFHPTEQDCAEFFEIDSAGVVSVLQTFNFIAGRAGCGYAAPGKLLRNPITPNGKSCRPSGRQLGRQLSPREIWTYGEKSGWRPTGSHPAGEKLPAKWPPTWPSTFS